MPVNPNQIVKTVTPAQIGTAAATLTLTLQQFDDDARLYINGTVTKLTGNLFGSLDGVTYFPTGGNLDLDGSPLSNPMGFTTFPTSFWINAGAWNYLQFVPTAITGTSVTLTLQSGVDLGGPPAQAASFNQNAAMVAGLSILTDTDLLGLVSAT